MLPWKASKPKRIKRNIPWPKGAQPLATKRHQANRLSVNRRQEGQFWEAKACAYLQAHGLVFVARNVYCRCGEIDLVMRSGATAVIVEVRRRASMVCGSAADSIDAHKQRKIMQAARFWWQTAGAKQFEYIRFDVVLFEQDEPPNWVQHAWTESGWL
jgi:putative endonuclease